VLTSITSVFGHYTLLTRAKPIRTEAMIPNSNMSPSFRHSPVLTFHKLTVWSSLCHSHVVKPRGLRRLNVLTGWLRKVFRPVLTSTTLHLWSFSPLTKRFSIQIAIRQLTSVCLEDQSCSPSVKSTPQANLTISVL